MRAHTHVESHIQRLKESGLNRIPFTSFEANANWLLSVAISCADSRQKGSWKNLLAVSAPGSQYASR